MGDWLSPVLFTAMLVAFVLGISSIIMSFFQPNVKNSLVYRIEYGFFGVSGLIATAVLMYALWWQ